jgi:signal transduction histidine kinase
VGAALTEYRAADKLESSIATMTPTGRQRQLALAFIAVVLIATGIIVPFDAVQLQRIDGFIPVTESAITISDFFTAVLLFGQAKIVGSRGLLLLAIGYLFSALMVFAHLLTFPGAFAPSGLLGAGLSTTAWFFLFWHLGLPVSVIGYTYLIDERRTLTVSAIWLSITFVIGLACVLTWIVTAHDDALPALFVDHIHVTRLGSHVTSIVFFVSLIALAALCFRGKSVLDLWLIVAICVLVAELGMTAFIILSRFSLGFYAQRVFSMVASTFVLSALLAEAVVLYARLSNAIALLQRERADRLANAQAATAAMAHELRQPLTGIATRDAAGVNWLKRTPPELNKARECFQSVIDASLHANEIIAAIRDLYKKTPTKHTMVQINEIVREVLALVQDDFRANAVIATLEYQENLPLIHASHSQIQQVILNLVTNSVEAMRSVPINKRRLRLTTGFDGKTGVAVYIQDSGPGIAPENQERIFEPFFTTKSSGTGLGLPICRSIVEDHGGALHLSKTNSGGTSFELILPLGFASHTSPPNGAEQIHLADQIID